MCHFGCSVQLKQQRNWIQKIGLLRIGIQQLNNKATQFTLSVSANIHQSATLQQQSTMKLILPFYTASAILGEISASVVDKSWLRASLGHREAQAKIVGGETAGSYPAYAKLSSNTDSFCGSTLIHPDILISAAHCDGFVGDSAYLGSNKVDGSDADEVIKIVAERIHPRYGRDDSPDIMLYKLERSSTVNPVSMHPNSGVPSNNELVRSIGFGLTSDGGSTSNVLLQVDVNAVDHDKCDEAYDNTLIENDMVCAAAPGKDTCQNDSGGPLLLSLIHI